MTESALRTCAPHAQQCVQGTSCWCPSQCAADARVFGAHNFVHLLDPFEITQLNSQVLYGDWCEHAGREAAAEAGLATAFDAETVEVVVRDALAVQGMGGK